MNSEGQDKTPNAVDGRRQGLYMLSGVAALTLGVLLLSAALSLVTAGLPRGLANNWLMTLFKLNAGFDRVRFDQLYGPNLLDISIMTLVAITYFGLCVALKQRSWPWSLLAAVIPLLGIVLFLVTKLAGRSGVMAAGIVIAFVMLRNSRFSRVVATGGILANVLLLVGDFGTSAHSPSAVIAFSMGIGYVLLLIWFFLLAQTLLHLGQNTFRQQDP